MQFPNDARYVKLWHTKYTGQTVIYCIHFRNHTYYIEIEHKMLFCNIPMVKDDLLSIIYKILVSNIKLCITFINLIDMSLFIILFQ